MEGRTGIVRKEVIYVKVGYGNFNVQYENQLAKGYKAILCPSLVKACSYRYRLGMLIHNDFNVSNQLKVSNLL